MAQCDEADRDVGDEDEQYPFGKGPAGDEEQHQTV